MESGGLTAKASFLTCGELARLFSVPRTTMSVWIKKEKIIPDAFASVGKAPLFARVRGIDS